MSVRCTWRTVPTGRGQEFHRLGSEPVIDLGWIVASADPARPEVELSLMSHEDSMSVAFDVMHSRVPCFFGRAPDGNVVNVVSRR